MWFHVFQFQWVCTMNLRKTWLKIQVCMVCMYCIITQVERRICRNWMIRLVLILNVFLDGLEILKVQVANYTVHCTRWRRNPGFFYMIRPFYFLLRPERSKGLPFFCVAWQRDNLRSSLTGKSCLQSWQIDMRFGSNDLWGISEVPAFLNFFLATRRPSLFSNLDPEMAV